MNVEAAARRVSVPVLRYRPSFAAFSDVQEPQILESFCSKCRLLLDPLVNAYNNRLYQMEAVARGKSQGAVGTLKRCCSSAPSGEARKQGGQNRQNRPQQSQLQKSDEEFHRSVISQYRAKIAALGRDLEASQQSIRHELLKQENKHNEVLAKAFAEKDALQAENLRIQQNADYLKIQLQILQQERSALKFDCQKAQEQEQKLLQQIQRCRQEQLILSENLDKQKRSAAQIEQRAQVEQNWQAQRARMTEQIAELRQALDKQGRERDTLQAALEAAEERAQQEQIRNEYLRAHIAHLETAVSRMQAAGDLSRKQIDNCAQFNKSQLLSNQIEAAFSFHFPPAETAAENEDEELFMARILTESEARFVEAHGEVLKFAPETEAFAGLPREAIKYGFEKLQNDCFGVALLEQHGVPRGVARNAQLDDQQCRRACGNYMFFRRVFGVFQCNYFSPSQCTAAAQVIYAGFEIGSRSGAVFLHRGGDVVYF